MQNNKTYKIYSTTENALYDITVKNNIITDAVWVHRGGEYEADITTIKKINIGDNLN